MYPTLVLLSTLIYPLFATHSSRTVRFLSPLSTLAACPLFITHVSAVYHPYPMPRWHMLLTGVEVLQAHY
jgi:hypothetical protein